MCDNQSWRFFNKYLSSCGKIENYVNLIEKCKTESIYWYPWQIEVDNVVQTFTEREMCVDRRRSDGRTFHHVWVSLINHHLIPPTPANILENLEQIFSHYILLFCAHTKLIFFFSYARTSIILMSKWMSDLAIRKISFLQSPYPRFLIHFIRKVENILSHRISKFGSLWAECVWHVDWLWFASVSSENEMKSNKKKFIVACNCCKQMKIMK